MLMINTIIMIVTFVALIRETYHAGEHFIKKNVVIAIMMKIMMMNLINIVGENIITISAPHLIKPIIIKFQ